MTLKNKDFIEIEFTASTKEGNVFDSNKKEELEKLHQGHDHEIETKPFVFSLGQDMFIKGVDEFLIGKDLGEYKINLSPEKAFGKRDPKLIQMTNPKVFKEQKLNPFPGATFNFDGRIGRVLTVSGGRIMIDFNNPLAGKEVIYNVNVKRVLTDLNEKIKSFIDFIFRKDFKFEVKEKNLIIHAEKGMKQFIELFKDKFKELFNLDLKVEEAEEKKEKPKEKEEEKPKEKSKEKKEEKKEKTKKVKEKKEGKEKENESGSKA